MAKKVQAFRAYSPRIEHNKLIETKNLAMMIDGRCSLTGGDFVDALYQLRWLFLYYAKSGTPIRLDGVGIFSPTINKDGVFSMKYRPDPGLLGNMNDQENFKFEGTIVNANMIGKSADDMIDRWNNEHPDDKIEK